MRSTSISSRSTPPSRTRSRSPPSPGRSARPGKPCAAPTVSTLPSPEADVLHEVDVGEQSIRNYRHSAGERVVHQLHDLASPLRGARILHISATPYGGGVAALLRSEIPLLRDLGN